MAERGLLFDMMVYLGAAVVFVPLAKRLRLGSVLGYLVAGCAIGPFGLGLVQDVESILHVAEFGVVLMLFVIGLELEPKRLWGMRRAVFGGGTLQMATCGVVLGLAAFAAGLSWEASLVVGLALSLSSTAIAVQTMAERNLMGTPLGQVSFSILLFQDVAAIPLIAIVPLLAESQPNAEPGWLAASKVFGAIIAVVFLGRYLTRPLLRAVARADLREVSTAFALLLVVAIAELMSLSGASMALGAFLAGVLLASSEYRHALETDIEPFKGLLMGLFFIGVGMSINFDLFAQEPVLVVGLVAGFLALKGLMLAVLSRPLGAGGAPRGLFAALLSQGGEFAFVVFGVARTARVLPGGWDGRLTLVVALSMAATPLLLLIQDLLVARRAAQRKQVYDQIETSETPVLIAGFGRFGQIVGRLLFATGIRATVLDHDPDQIELLRKFGFRIFYGDATRWDLLESAGIRTAQVLVNAIDDIQDNLALVDLAREHCPNLKIVARARNVAHYFELRRRGVEVAERETFEAALHAGRRTLEALGVAPYEAREHADRFRRHNLLSLEVLRSPALDDAHRVSAARAAREELEAQFERDRAALAKLGAVGWHDERSDESSAPVK